MTHLSGIDISKHQGSVDFDAVVAEGQCFVICKATEGEGYVDPKFFESWAELVERENRLYRGAYHFARPDSTGGAADGAAEARDFCDALKAAGGYMAGALPPALDYEKYSGHGTAANLAFIDSFCKTVEDTLGRSCMIYTGATVWGYQTNDSDAWTDLPLWLVDYTPVGGDGVGDPPDIKDIAWDTWTFWQWSGGGEFQFGPDVDGKTIDLNWFNGSAQDLAALAMMPDAGAPEPCPPDREAALRLLGSVQDDLVSALAKVEMLQALVERGS